MYYIADGLLQLTKYASRVLYLHRLAMYSVLQGNLSLSDGRL